MLELIPVSANVIACLAEPSAVDAAAAAWRGTALRIAPDEAMLVGNEATEAVAGAAAALDADALVADVTDGWAIWRIEGREAAAALERLSQVPVERGFAQGRVAGAPAKVVVESDAVVLLVPAMSGEAVRERIAADCRSLGIRESPGPRAWGIDPSGAGA